jgi:heme-degrading monooxygenase HmoA
VYVSVSRLRIVPDRVDELVVAFRARARLVESHDGFVDLQVWQSDREVGEILMVSRWRTRGCFQAYMRSGDHRISHARIDPGLEDAIRLERLEHMSTYDVVAE